MISYLHLTKAGLGAFICPLSPKDVVSEKGQYGQSEEEIAYIESSIKPMSDIPDDDADN